jgi:hypothetical protein
MALTIIVTMDVVSWLQFTAKARGNNLPLVIPAGTTVRGQLVADNNLPYVLLDAIQFDGVLSGQLAFEIQSGIQRIAGWAVPAIIQNELLLSEKGQPIRYEFRSSQTTDAVVNLDYFSCDVHVVENEIMPAFYGVALGAR